MNIDDEIEALYDKCKNSGELRAEISKIMEAHGHLGEKWVNLTIRALFDGTTVYLRPDGQYENKWRRKFQEPIPPEEFRIAQASRELHPA